MLSVIRLNVMAPTANLMREIIGIDSKRKKKNLRRWFGAWVLRLYAEHHWPKS